MQQSGGGESRKVCVGGDDYRQLLQFKKREKAAEINKTCYF